MLICTTSERQRRLIDSDGDASMEKKRNKRVFFKMAHQSDLISQNIEQYLKSTKTKEILRFITCGSVDDGKSTLIGRLLYDSKMIFEDQLAAIEKIVKSWNNW